jgi:hypothetical protein
MSDDAPIGNSPNPGIDRADVDAITNAAAAAESEPTNDYAETRTEGGRA